MYTIYSKEDCVFCVRAKNLLTRLGLEYKEYNVYDYMEDLIGALGEKPKTVPQIFDPEGIYIGGYEELAEKLS